MVMDDVRHLGVFVRVADIAGQPLSCHKVSHLCLGPDLGLRHEGSILLEYNIVCNMVYGIVHSIVSKRVGYNNYSLYVLLKLACSCCLMRKDSGCLGLLFSFSTY